MLQGINIFDFFLNKEDRRWNNADVKEYLVTLENENVPAFSVVVPTSVATPVLGLYDAMTDELKQAYSITTITAYTGYQVLTFIGATKTGLADGYYYMQLTHAGIPYYGEVFAWESDASCLAEMIKFNVDASDVTMAGTYVLDFSSFELDFYLFINGISIEGEITEDGVEKPYGDIPTFNTLNIKRKVSINGNDQIYRFLAALRILQGNGTITVSTGGIVKSIYDITTDPISSESFDETLIIDFGYKETDFVSMRNEI